MEGVREVIVFLCCCDEYRRAMVDYPIVVVGPSNSKYSSSHEKKTMKYLFGPFILGGRVLIKYVSS